MTLLEALRKVHRPMTVNGKRYRTGEEMYWAWRDHEGMLEVHIEGDETDNQALWIDGAEYRIAVKEYMIRPSTPSFDFHLQWNHNKPMPLRYMQGSVLRQTPGMVRMKLSEVIGLDKCPMCCDENAEHGSCAEAYLRLKPPIAWEGWIIKSAVLERALIGPLK